MRPLVLPQISLNGTDRQSLVDQQRDVITALDAVIHAMAQAMPHGRDYQYRPAAYPLARDAWVERMSGLVDLKREIERHGVAIMESDQ